MRRVFVFIVLAIATATVATAQAGPRLEHAQQGDALPRPDPPGTFRNRPHDAQLVPPTSVDYVATLVRHPIAGPVHEERFERIRSDRWQRETLVNAEHVTAVSVSDFQTGISYGWSDAADGARRSFSASLDSDQSDHEVFYRTRTDRLDTVLGERCVVWEWRRLAPYQTWPGHVERPWLSCVTADGVEMWLHYFGYEGDEVEYTRVVRLERRRVRREEVAPPGDLFDWETWRAADGGEAGDAADDYEIVYAAAAMEHRPLQNDSELVRMRRAWRYQATTDEPQGPSWRITGPALSLYYVENSRGRSLQISRIASLHLAGPAALISPSSGETVLGQSCRWYDTAVGVSHLAARECRTSAGVVLARFAAGDGVLGGNGYFNVRAVRMSRAPLPATAIEPPARALDWPRQP